MKLGLSQSVKVVVARSFNTVLKLLGSNLMREYQRSQITDHVLNACLIVPNSIVLERQKKTKKTFWIYGACNWQCLKPVLVHLYLPVIFIIIYMHEEKWRENGSLQ